MKITNLNTTNTRPLQLGRGFQRILMEEGSAQHVDVHVNVISVGASPGPYHFHEHCENIYIVLSGTLEAVVDGTRYLLKKDDVAFIPRGVPHSAGNAGNVEAVAIEINAPPRGKDFHVVQAPGQIRNSPSHEEPR